MAQTQSLAGRVAVVTGANHGIGAETALELGRRGAAVLVTYLRFDAPEDDPGRPVAYGDARRGDASSTIEALRELGATCVAVEEDLADAGAPVRIFDRAEVELGPVEILVNNASSWRKDTFGDDTRDRFGRELTRVTAATIDGQLAVDARAAALLISEFARRLIDRGGAWGRILSLTSGGPQGFPGEVSYGAAKAALENYTMSAAQELGPHGVTANVVYPPITNTGWITPEVEAVAATLGPRHRVVEPASVAGVIAWLCSNDADAVTSNLIRLY